MAAEAVVLNSGHPAPNDTNEHFSFSFTQSGNGQSYRGPFTIMTVLFFMWGFMTVLNDILIPRLQEAFTLTNYQIMFVQIAFFGAYFIGSLLYFAISATAGDPIARIGYKNGVVIGLLLAAIGSAMFWPAASQLSYPLFLGGLFVVGLGFAMLQIAANPYVTILGPERTASSRLNLAQAFNSLGTTTGPLIGGYLIYEYFSKTGAQRGGVGENSLPRFFHHLRGHRRDFFLPASAARRRGQD